MAATMPRNKNIADPMISPDSLLIYILSDINIININSINIEKY